MLACGRFGNPAREVEPGTVEEVPPLVPYLEHTMLARAPLGKWHRLMRAPGLDLQGSHLHIDRPANELQGHVQLSLGIGLKLRHS